MSAWGEMSGIPVCPVCGEPKQPGGHACPGPRGGKFSGVRSELVTLPGDDADDTAESLLRILRHAPREDGT